MTNQVEHILPADKKLRKQLLIGVILFSIVMLPFMHLLFSYLQKLKILARSDTTQALLEVRRFLLGLTVVNAAVTASFAFHFLRTASRTWKFRRFPPPGMRVLRDTRVRRGAPARTIAVILCLLAFTIMLPNIALLYLDWIL